MLQILTSENIFTLENFLTFFFQFFFFFEIKKKLKKILPPRYSIFSGDHGILVCQSFFWSPEGETFVFEFVR